MKLTESTHVAGTVFTVTVETPDALRPELSLYTTQPPGSADTYLLNVAVSHPDRQPFTLSSLTIEWTVPIVDMHGLYFGSIPKAELAHLPYWWVNRSTCANTGVPYTALINRNGENRLAVGSFDQITETSLFAELSETTRSYHFRLKKPSNAESNGQTIPIADRWTETLFVSTARRPWQEVLSQYVTLNDQHTSPPAMRVPEHAFDPVFCTWTAIHHDVSHEWILRNARIAAGLGFRTWITDDGWFIEDGHFADYSRAGDWQPCVTKFPDFRRHVQAVQELGFHYVLWVAPFMVGCDSQAAQRYIHLLIDGRGSFSNLSPWHDETRQVVADLLGRLVRDYGLDGLKVDFIDAISADGERRPGASDETMGKRLATVLTEAITPLLDVQPELLVEFRNSYANLASRRYANIYRSGDVPINPLLNRWQAVMLRLLAPDRAVHLDPALWHPDDTDENVAAHLINLLVSVPMVSIELDQYPQSHLDLIRYWIGFYNSHRHTLVHGRFEPVLCEGYIPAVYFGDNSEQIVAVYNDVPIALRSGYETIWVLNATTRSYIEFPSPRLHGSYTVVTRDKYGTITGQQAIGFPVERLPVEIGGSLEILDKAG